MAGWAVAYTWAMDVGQPELVLGRDIGCVGSGAGVSGNSSVSFRSSLMPVVAALLLSSPGAVS